MRINELVVKLNISLDRAYTFLNSKGYDIVKKPNLKLTDEQENVLKNEFAKDQENKLISQNSKLTSNLTTEEKIEDYTEIKNRYKKDYLQACEIRTIILNEIKAHQSIKNSNYYIIELIEQKKKIIEKLINDNIVAFEQFENIYNGFEFEDDDFEIEDDDFEPDDKNIANNSDDQSESNTKEWGRYSDDNPWNDVFGDSDEAETAFWNTD
jgi:hypothetical protein